MSHQPLDNQARPRVMSKRGKGGVAAAYFVAGILATPVASFLAIASAGAGHGQYEFARLLFPYSMLLTLTTGDTITNPLIALALAQFPAYGMLLAGAALKSTKVFFVVAIGIGVVHSIAAAACFSGVLPSFS